jgi:hypothetical protein
MKYIILILGILFWVPATIISQEIYYLQGSSQKIEQLVGDYDRELVQATANLTETNYQIWGTDLGIPFEHKGKTYIVFGDVPGNLGFGSDRDPIAYTEDSNPNDGIDLTFLTQSPGLYQPVTIPGISQGAFEVPLDGISKDDVMYLYHSTDQMKRSVLARSMDDGVSFELVEDTISVTYFINISVNKVERMHYPDLPGNFEQGIVVLGSGDYRNSAIYMYCQAEDSIAYKESIYYFSGYEGQEPQWSKNEMDAIPVIDIDCAGELSSAYNAHLEKWLVLYNCDDPRGIQLRTADMPWGPYSDAEVIFEPWADEGYCHFIHTSWVHSVCDSVHDPGRAYEWGGEYGPYMFKELSTRVDSFVTIYYTLSTWNPYTSVLMKSTLVKPDLVAAIPETYDPTEFSVYPNPTSGRFTISASELTVKDLSVELRNFTGKWFVSLENTREIDLSGFPEGIYFGQVFYKDQALGIFKIVKTR